MQRVGGLTMGRNENRWVRQKLRKSKTLPRKTNVGGLGTAMPGVTRTTPLQASITTSERGSPTAKAARGGVIATAAGAPPFSTALSCRWGQTPHTSDGAPTNGLAEPATKPIEATHPVTSSLQTTEAAAAKHQRDNGAPGTAMG